MKMIEKLHNSSSELVRPLKTEEEIEKMNEFQELEALMIKLVGFDMYSKYEYVQGELLGINQVRAYTQGFKDAFKLFKELEL